MTTPRRRKPVAAPLASSRTLARPLAPHAVTDAPRGYPTAAALFASGRLASQFGTTLRALLGPAALMGAVGVAACGPLDAPPKTDPATDPSPGDAKPPPHKPDDAASPPNDVTVPGTPSVVLTPLPPQFPDVLPRPPRPRDVDTGHPPRPPHTPPIVSGPLPPLPRPPIARGAMQHIEPEPPRPEPQPHHPEPIRPRPEPIPLAGAPMPVHPPPLPPPPIRPAPHAPQAPGRIMVRPDVE